MTPVTPLRKSWTDSFVLAFAATRIFPLLCPVLEYDWIEDWRCELVYSKTGVAEDGCIFKTELTGAGTMTWIVSRYEPNVRIEFACLVDGVTTMRLKIALESVTGGTQLTWTREFTALSAKGEAWVAALTDADHTQLMQRLEAMLNHYLKTGTMLRGVAPKAQARQ